MTESIPVIAGVAVRKIETVTGDFLTEPGEPFWRIEIDGYCADFDHEQAAENFAAAMNARTAELLAALYVALEDFDNWFCGFDPEDQASRMEGRKVVIRARAALASARAIPDINP